MRLKDRVAIITGAGNGMGAADALLFAKEGAKVVINDIRQENADAVAKQIQDAGGEAFVSTADVTKTEDVEAMVAETILFPTPPLPLVIRIVRLIFSNLFRIIRPLKSKSYAGSDI